MNITPYPYDIANLGRSMRADETRHALIFAGAGFIAMLAFLLVYSITAAVFEMPTNLYKIGFVIIVFMGGFVIFGALVSGWRLGAGYVSRVFKVWELQNKLEKLQEPVAPTLPTKSTPTLPTLPTGNDAIRFTSFGGGVQDIPRRLVRGFDMRDIETLCKYLEHGGKWTEAMLEHYPLVYTGGFMGKAQEGTAYSVFVDWCVESGVILGREGKRSGTLAILDAGEMLKRLKDTGTP